MRWLGSSSHLDLQCLQIQLLLCLALYGSRLVSGWVSAVGSAFQLVLGREFAGLIPGFGTFFHLRGLSVKS